MPHDTSIELLHRPTGHPHPEGLSTRVPPKASPAGPSQTPGQQTLPKPETGTEIAGNPDRTKDKHEPTRGSVRPGSQVEAGSRSRHGRKAVPETGFWWAYPDHTFALKPAHSQKTWANTHQPRAAQARPKVDPGASFRIVRYLPTRPITKGNSRTSWRTGGCERLIISVGVSPGHTPHERFANA